jgi:Hydrazine synthase alpha subunit middle domain/WD40-like Beta Propeller Repeat
MHTHARERNGRLWSGAALVSALLGLAACTSGDGGGTPGGSQGPDPVVLDFPIAYVKHPVPEMDTQLDARRLLDFREGGDLYVRDRASPSSSEVNVTGEITGGLGDVRDVEGSFDGTKLVFAMREPLIEGADEEDQPTWNIWEYEVASRTLRRVIPSDIIAEEGHDFAPHYLPDGRIVFTSTRQRQSRAILLDEGKPQFAAQDEDREEPAFVLHVMNADGSDIHQISFNQSHDLDPAVLDDGRIVFSRWDNAGPQSEIHLYAVRPDGSGLELLYGAQSHMTGTDGSEVHFLDPRPMASGELLVRAQPFTAVDFGGQLLSIDTTNYVEDTQPNLTNSGVLTGPAQKPATPNQVVTIPGPSLGGRYSSAFPLPDGTGRILVSWNQCRLLDVDERIIPCTEELLEAGTALAAPPIYGIWIYDPRDETQLPVVAPTEGWVYTDAVALQPVPLPPVLLDRIAGVDYDAELATEGVGILDIRSVYDMDGVDSSPAGLTTLADPALTTAAERPARFLRIEKAVGLPDEDLRDFAQSAFGVRTAFGMRQILGYVPVEPDGSARAKLPANVPFAVTVLDADGRRIGPRHDNWLQLRPGEESRCNGCHEPDSGLSHGRSNLFAAVNNGAATTGQPFPNTNPAFFANSGETMAQTRARISCQTDCAALEPSLNIVFDDVWTDPVAANRAPDPSFAYRYADLQTAAPTSPDCMTGWRAGCRATIHYEQHIHPLWSKPRVTLAADGVTVLADDTCTICHAAGAALDLSDGASAAEPDHFRAYRELLATDDGQADPLMVAGNASASVNFFSVFAPGGTHYARLTPAELKLISEWLDIGAQYFNDPFTAPLD